MAQQAPRLHSTGNNRIDNLLGGGLPIGSVCELTGPEGSGRCSIALSLLASASSVGACAYIDVSDTLSPQSAAAAGSFGHQILPPTWQPHTIPKRPVRLSLLCESQTGYRNLSLLISSYKLAQHTKGDGVASFRKVQEHAEGLACMTGGDEGPLASVLERGGMDEGRRTLSRLVQTFGPKNIYVELQRHGICEQEARNRALITLAREFHLPLLATNGVAMATDFEREILDVLTTIRHGCSLDEAGLLLQQNNKRHMRSRRRDVPALSRRSEGRQHRRAVGPTHLRDEGHGLRIPALSDSGRR